MSFNKNAINSVKTLIRNMSGFYCRENRSFYITPGHVKAVDINLKAIYAVQYSSFCGQLFSKMRFTKITHSYFIGPSSIVPPKYV